MDVLHMWNSKKLSNLQELLDVLIIINITLFSLGLKFVGEPF